MKRVYLLLLILLTVACEPENYHITGILSVDNNSTIAQLYDYKTGELIERAEIIDGVFTFIGNVRNPMVVNLVVGEQKNEDEEIIFILEEGQIAIDFSSLYISGTPLNDALELFKQEMLILETDVQQEMQNIISDVNLSQEQKEETLDNLEQKIGGFVDALIQTYLTKYPELSPIFEEDRN